MTLAERSWSIIHREIPLVTTVLETLCTKGFMSRGCTKWNTKVSQNSEFLWLNILPMLFHIFIYVNGFHQVLFHSLLKGLYFLSELISEQSSLEWLQGQYYPITLLKAKVTPIKVRVTDNSPLLLYLYSYLDIFH